jgi:hypothetical protein
MAFTGAVELKYHLLQRELVGEGRTTRKILVILNARIFRGPTFVPEEPTLAIKERLF